MSRSRAAHQCSQKCLTTHTSSIKDHIEKKLVNYRKSDSNTRFSSQPPTIDLQTAFELLVDSAGLCSICNSQLKLHNWPTSDPLQFSFDRLDDDSTHHYENLQITCVRCNIAKAEEVYRPVHGIAYVHYSSAVREFLQISDNIKLGLSSAADADYQLELKKYLAHQHDVVYGDRKVNRWKTPGLIVRHDKPQRTAIFLDDFWP